VTAFTVPVKEAAEEMVWELIAPLVVRVVIPPNVPVMVELPVTASPPVDTVRVLPIVATPEVCKVPAVVFKTPTPKPPVR